ncbi:hypothetical protein [Aurantiacibacter poecillastricola]|uniref:hypothetical protein n=1 Tax=Aurantiacibacter poecillastricola TaxID=3064385 RepID=UPI00273F4D4E|nr:hypothetical protein [Aurantiacibacter sp. 219JJ12-13]MDP5261644.1 hypothetical protein [Aurantiacibacter sp. 219JJ12-13]
MIASAAPFLLLAATTAAPAVDEARAHEVFWDACVDGEARFAPGEASAVDYSDLPPAIRNWFWQIDDGDDVAAYNVGQSGKLFLVIFEQEEPRGKEYSSGCAVIGANLSIQAAELFVRINLTTEGAQVGRCQGEFFHECPNGEYFDLYPEDFSYRVMGRELRGEYVALQVVQIPERTRDRHRVAISRRR